MKNQKTIVILGMHRSGTSMLAGILEKLGISMGKSTIEKSINNPFGYFEDYEFLDLNQRILKDASGSWKNPPLRDHILLTKEKYEKEVFPKLFTSGN